MARAFHAKTMQLLEAVNRLLDEYEGPVTLRQLFYRLVALQVIENKLKAYKSFGKHLVNGRREGIVDADRIVDRTRALWQLPTWTDLDEFLDAVRRSYRREKWSRQDYHVEVWCEKDAVAGVFEPITDEFEVALYPCRGYDSYSALREAGGRIRGTGKPAVILYFGDFDPSGEDIPRSFQKRLLEDFGTEVDLRVIALTAEQIGEYDLPWNAVKLNDTRAPAFLEKYGNIAVELDALDPRVLKDLLRGELGAYCHAETFEYERGIQAEEQARLEVILDAR